MSRFLKIVVSIKQVPETAQVDINPQTNTLVREGVNSIINPFDMYAIEEALRLRDKLGGKVTAPSMGPPQAETALREAISMGVNEAILLSDRVVVMTPRPGRVVADMPVNLSRPRSQELIYSPVFIEQARRVREAIGGGKDA